MDSKKDPIDCEFIDVENINSGMKTNKELKIKEYIEGIPDGKVSTLVLAAKHLGIGYEIVCRIIREKFPKCRKHSVIARKIYIGKPEVLEKLK